jgi:hypothetical protein
MQNFAITEPATTELNFEFLAAVSSEIKNVRF